MKKNEVIFILGLFLVLVVVSLVFQVFNVGVIGIRTPTQTMPGGEGSSTTTSEGGGGGGYYQPICISKPYYSDLCQGYRCVKLPTSFSSACYDDVSCDGLVYESDGTCVDAPAYNGDLCQGYRFISGISRSCYSLYQCKQACL